MANRNARQLRKAMTNAERRLWSALRDRQLNGFKFRRQRPIGPFIVDFACIERRPVVEADGGQHCDNEADRRRTGWLTDRGWIVIRFWNHDILRNLDGVREKLLEHLDRRGSDQPTLILPPAAGPSFSRKREKVL